MCAYKMLYRIQTVRESFRYNTLYFYAHFYCISVCKRTLTWFCEKTFLFTLNMFHIKTFSHNRFIDVRKDIKLHLYFFCVVRIWPNKIWNNIWKLLLQHIITNFYLKVSLCSTTKQRKNRKNKLWKYWTICYIYNK